MTQGKLYGVSVGPGDPELLTLKAVRILREADVIAAPRVGAGKQTALHIIESYIEGKELIDCSTPMTRDQTATAQAYDVIADRLAGLLDQGKTVAFVTLGDAGIYSTYYYVHERMVARGYTCEVIAGVTSFSAAAARLGMSLCQGSEQLTIAPVAAGNPRDVIDMPGTRVFMKAGNHLAQLCDELREQGQLSCAAMVAHCGLPDELIIRDMETLSGDEGYMSVVIVKDKNSAPAPSALDGSLTEAAHQAPDKSLADAAREESDKSLSATAANSAPTDVKAYPFFTNKQCPYFPCHEDIDPDQFNCLFCYCPLYVLGQDCGGNFTMTEAGVKNCTTCTLPHEGDSGTRMVSKRWQDLKALCNQESVSAQTPKAQGEK